jgi:nucleoside-diphosphate-sugar epimerase
MKEDMIVVAGAGGFIGGHFVNYLRQKGYSSLRAVDIKTPEDWYQRFEDVENLQLDLSEKEAARKAVQGASQIYNLACNMGGIGFIEHNKAHCMLSVLINTHMLMAAREFRAQRYFYSSSACVYAADKQSDPHIIGLRESDSYPAMPEDGYGWEKLFSERMCRHFSEDFDLITRVARYHNVYGPHGTYDGGREKAPAAICRKVIHAKLSGNNEIEIWGNGEQTRSFMFIDDCLYGTHEIMKSENIDSPINLGSTEKVTINELLDIVEGIAGVKLKRHYNLDSPKGVNGRNSENTLIRKMLNWEPSTPLRVGMEKTYSWIYNQIKSGASKNAAYNRT